MFDDAITPVMPEPELLDTIRRDLLRGLPVPENSLPDAVARSWERSRDAGVHPWDSRMATSLQRNIPLSEDDVELAQCVQEELERLWDVFGGENWCLFCVNVDGVIINSVTDATAPPLSLLSEGTSLAEANIGTTAPACTLKEQRPFVFSGPHHYLKEFDRFFCVSVPLFGADNMLAGALDITGIGERNTDVVFEQLRLSAMAVENKLFIKHFADANIYSVQSSHTLLGTPFEGLIALNDENKLIATNYRARQILQLRRQATSLPFQGPGLGQSGSFTEKLRLPDGTFVYSRRVGNTAKVDSTQCQRQASPFSNEPAIDKHYQIAIKALSADIPIMISGETGTGKEVFAKALHEAIDAESPYVAINCSAMPESLIEAELFGYEEGSFTGARKGGASGRLEDADGGTLLLDEIGDMPVRLQTRLLRFLQEREVTRIGSSVKRAVSIRIICATHRDLNSLVSEHAFREDLFYRLKGMKVTLPPLRERRDWKGLTQSILAEFGHFELHRDALSWLMRQSWPGNIRQLRQTLHLATVIAGDEKWIKPEHLLEYDAYAKDECPLTLDAIEKRAIEQAVHRHNGNLTAAAAELGISRTTLYSKRKTIDR